MTRPRRLLGILLLVAGCAPAASPTPTGAPATSTPPPTAAPTPSAAPSSAPTTSCAELGIPGGRIAFTVGDGQANGIGVVNADGSGYHTVVEAKDIPGQPNGGTEGPAWSGPGRLLFDSNRSGGPDDWHIFAVDADGGRLVQLTKGAEGIENFPVLSPTGTFMAFAKYLATGDPNEPFGAAESSSPNPTPETNGRSPAPRREASMNGRTSRPTAEPLPSPEGIMSRRAAASTR